jgi:ABC-type lipoprotein export system ATPase subunit
MLELRDVSRVFRNGDVEVVALKNANLRIVDGDYVSIVGPSGSGKSTLLNLIGLLDKPTEGQIMLDGRDVGSLGDSERSTLRLRTIGFVFQRFHLLSLLSAIENVALPMEDIGVSVSERYARARLLLAQVGLDERLFFVPGRLSGGERQRVAVCRALANKPRLILADEPTGELHSEDKVRVLELFRRLNAEGHSLVVVTHDPEVAAQARRTIEIRDGSIQREVMR